VKGGRLRLGLFLPLLVAACGGAGAEREMSADEVAATLQEMRIVSGQWQTSRIVTGATGPNMPRQVQQAMLRRRDIGQHCITPVEAARPAASFLARQGASQCRYYGFSYADGRMQGMMRCTGGGMPGTMETRIEGRYAPDRMDVTMTMNATGQPRGADATITTRISGRRIGACTAAAAANG
jgi:Protein of unknown function (DUF3617)